MMNNNRAYQLFCKATSRTICTLTDCDKCREIHGTDYCVADVNIPDKEILEFVAKVAHLLRDWGDDMPFTPDITEDELLALLKVSAGEGEV